MNADINTLTNETQAWKVCVCVCSLSSSIWVEVAPEMFTGGFSPSTYCQQFKGLSAPTLCIQYVCLRQRARAKESVSREKKNRKERGYLKSHSRLQNVMSVNPFARINVATVHTVSANQGLNVLKLYISSCVN